MKMKLLQIITRIQLWIQICSYDVDAAVVHLHRHSQPFNAFERPMKSSSYALYDELVDIMSCDPH
jgi:hypothetical protein